MTAAPLGGHGVVVTRARSQSSVLVERLTGLGATVVELPVIVAADPRDGGDGLALAAGRLCSGAYDWVALTSANAVGRLLAALAALAPATVPASVRWAAVGPGTARALLEGSVRADLVPAVARCPSPWPRPSPSPAPSRVARCCSRGPSRCGVRWPPGCGPRGGRSTKWSPTGRWRGEPDAAAVDSARRCEAIAFTSSSTVARSVDLLGTEGMPTRGGHHRAGHVDLRPGGRPAGGDGGRSPHHRRPGRRRGGGPGR